MKFSVERFQAVPIIGIIRGISKEKIPTVISKFIDAGFTTIEITMNTPGAAQAISQALDHYGKHLNIGAGTVRNLQEMKMALDAGAQFIVSPIFDQKIVKSCVEQGIPAFPGAYTPTEVYTAWRSGATAVKIFPTITGGIKHIKAIQGPLDSVPLIPTGGIDKENLKEYLDLGLYGIGVGSKLFPKNLIAKDDWESLTKHLKDFKAVYDDWRQRQTRAVST